MRKFILFVANLAFSLALQAQDLILKTDGSKVLAKVLEIGISEVKYHRFDNLSGPVYSLPKSEISKIIYEDDSQDVFEKPANTSALPATAADLLPASRQYKVLDYYNENGVSGIVVKVADDGRYGLMMSLEITTEYWCTNKNLWNSATNAFSQDDGEKNMTAIEEFVNSGKAKWKDFPIFEWARNMGNGWYIPASDELQDILVTLNGGAVDYDYQKFIELNYAFLQYRGHAIFDGVNHVIKRMASSTESANDKAYMVAPWAESFRAAVNLKEGKGLKIKAAEQHKKWIGGTIGNGTRAVHKFTVAQSAFEQEPTYRLLDYYNENGVSGIVVKVTDGGRHGLLMSLGATYEPWCTNDKLKNATSAFSQDDGEKNMEAIAALVNSGKAKWMDFPLFLWARQRGDGWYIPASDELQEALVNINGGSIDFSYPNFESFTYLLARYNGVTIWMEGGKSQYPRFSMMYSSTDAAQGRAYVVGAFAETLGKSVNSSKTGTGLQIKATEQSKKMFGGDLAFASRAVHKF
jgi:hypothetical protein